MSKTTAAGVYLHGNADKPAIIFLHSSLSSSAQWRKLIRLLKLNFYCINIDLLGYGKAPQIMDVGRYSLEGERERIMRVINSLIGDNPFHVIGHSYGGVNALKLGLSLNNRILSMVLFEPVAFHLLDKACRHRQQMIDFGHKLATLDPIPATQFFTDTWSAQGYFNRLPAIIQKNMVKNIHQVTCNFNAGLKELNTLQDCQRLNMPITLVQGRLSPESAHVIVNSLSNVLSNCRQYEIDSGHMGPITHHQEFNEIVLNQLNEWY